MAPISERSPLVPAPIALHSYRATTSVRGRETAILRQLNGAPTLKFISWQATLALVIITLGILLTSLGVTGHLQHISRCSSSMN